MKTSSPVGPVRVPAYNFIRHSLPAGRGRGSKACGGVGLYVRRGLKATTVIKSTHDATSPIASRVEYMVVQIKVNELSIGVAVLYNPLGTNTTFSQHYEKVLLDMLDFGFDRTYIVGDFNINVAAGSPSANLTALHRIHAAFNLTILHTGPTRITDTSSTTIDLLITDGPQHIKKAKAASVSSVSDHEVVYLVADIRVKYEEMVILYKHREKEIKICAESRKEREKQMAFADMQLRSAIKIQAWWRGTMVRKGLGPFKKKKKSKPPKASKKGKKGK
ncbi:hypothetical protein quinque_001442 [Culex quinquefasciatus]